MKMTQCEKCGKDLNRTQILKGYFLCYECYLKKNPIYKKYYKKGSSSFSELQEKQLQKLIADLKGWKLAGCKSVPPDEINMLIRRYAGTSSWSLALKERYFKFWYKILVKRGFIENCGLEWILTDKLLKEGKMEK
jgi:hypothetical protein